MLNDMTNNMNTGTTGGGSVAKFVYRFNDPVQELLDYLVNRLERGYVCMVCRCYEEVETAAELSHLTREAKKRGLLSECPVFRVVQFRNALTAGTGQLEG